MVAAQAGLLGDTIQGQANEINQQLANVAINYEGPAAATAWALVKTYPYQFGARWATNYLYMKGTGYITGGAASSRAGYMSGFSVAYGSMAHEVYNAGVALPVGEAMLTAAGALGILCKPRKSP